MPFFRNSRARALANGLAIGFCISIVTPSCDSSDDVNGTDLHGDAGAGGGTDSGTGSGDAVASSCVPGDVSTFAGGDYHPPVSAFQGACDDDAIEAYIDCRKNSNPVSCGAFASGDGAKCLSCIETKPDAANWGPVLIDAAGTNGKPNLPGCLALAFGEGQSTTGCAATTQKSFNCQTLACAANCTSSTGEAKADDLLQCENAALVGGCKPFDDAAHLACTEDAGGADAMCYRATYEDGGASEDEWSYIARLSKYFCGYDDSVNDAGAALDGGG